MSNQVDNHVIEVPLSKQADQLTDYPDNNGNGVPDAFENRRSITEILNTDFKCESDQTVIVELELAPRSPKKGEYYIIGGEIHKSMYDYRSFTTICIRRVLHGQMLNVKEVSNG